MRPPTLVDLVLLFSLCIFAAVIVAIYRTNDLVTANVLTAGMVIFGTLPTLIRHFKK